MTSLLTLLLATTAYAAPAPKEPSLAVPREKKDTGLYAAPAAAPPGVSPMPAIPSATGAAPEAAPGAAMLTPAATEQVGAALDDWHDAAAKADEARYFGRFTADAVFLGTDDTERWDVAAFREYARPHFEKGKAWTLAPKERHVMLSPDGAIAWFDEKVESPSYGASRGSGVLIRSTEGWKIAQYNLTVPIPNELLLEFAKKIQARQAKGSGTVFEDVDIKAASELIAAGKGDEDFVILDVRTVDEYNFAHIEGATNVVWDSSSFRAKAEPLDRGKTYLVHCAAGSRSARAVGVMKELGFRRLYNMKQGLSGWMEEGQPTTSDK